MGSLRSKLLNFFVHGRDMDEGVNEASYVSSLVDDRKISAKTSKSLKGEPISTEADVTYINNVLFGNVSNAHVTSELLLQQPMLEVDKSKCIQKLRELASKECMSIDDKFEFSTLVAMLKGKGVNLKQDCGVNVRMVDTSCYIAARAWFDLYDVMTRPILLDYKLMYSYNYAQLRNAFGLWNNSLMRLTNANVYVIFIVSANKLGGFNLVLNIYSRFNNRGVEEVNYNLSEKTTRSDYMKILEDIVGKVYYQLGGERYSQSDFTSRIKLISSAYSLKK